MVRLSRRRTLVLTGGVIGLAAGSFLSSEPLGVAPFRPATTVGMPPTENRFLTDQPRLSSGEGALSVELLRDEAEAAEKLVFADLPPTIGLRLRDIEADEFWTVIVGVLPTEKDLSAGAPGYSYDTLRYPNVIARSDPDLPTNREAGDPDEYGGALRFHYVFQRWTPTFPFPSKPAHVVANWKDA